jgi:hypothetical protein
MITNALASSFHDYVYMDPSWLYLWLMLECVLQQTAVTCSPIPESRQASLPDNQKPGPSGAYMAMEELTGGDQD